MPAFICEASLLKLIRNCGGMGEEAGVEISRGEKNQIHSCFFPLPFPELSVYVRKQQKPCALTAGWFMRSFIQDWPGLQSPFVRRSPVFPMPLCRLHLCYLDLWPFFLISINRTCWWGKNSNMIELHKENKFPPLQNLPISSASCQGVTTVNS